MDYSPHPPPPPPLREKYWEYEYEEVISPNMYNFDLWRTSGHADHYKVLRVCVGGSPLLTYMSHKLGDGEGCR